MGIYISQKRASPSPRRTRALNRPPHRYPTYPPQNPSPPISNQNSHQSPTELITSSRLMLFVSNSLFANKSNSLMLFRTGSGKNPNQLSRIRPRHDDTSP